MLVLRTKNYQHNNRTHRNLLGFINSTKIEYVENICYALNENGRYGCAESRMKDLKDI